MISNNELLNRINILLSYDNNMLKYRGNIHIKDNYLVYEIENLSEEKININRHIFLALMINHDDSKYICALLGINYKYVKMIREIINMLQFIGRDYLINKFLFIEN